MGCCPTKSNDNEEDKEKTPLVQTAKDATLVTLSQQEFTNRHTLPSPVNAPPPLPVPLHTELSNFQYLDSGKDYVLTRPDFPVQILQNAFSNLHEQYTSARHMRLKIDENLLAFKEILNVHPDLHLTECFRKWNAKLVNPVFTVTYSKKSRRDIKSIVLRDDEMPRVLWPTQKHIRIILDACHLYLEQFNFLQQITKESLQHINGVVKNLDSILSEASLHTADYNHLMQVVPRMQTEYMSVSEWIVLFRRQIEELMSEISEATEIIA